MPSPEHKRGRPRDPAIDRAIVDACVALLGEVGRAHLTRERIARRAGVSLPAVNRRYESVDAILRAVASTPMHAQALPEAPDLRSHLIDTLMRAAATLERLPIRRSAAELMAAAVGDPQIDAALGASLARQRAGSLELVARARERGELRPDADGELLLDLINGALYYRLLWRNQSLTAAEVEPLVDTVLAGFT